MPNYRAVKDGKEVLNVSTDEYEGLDPFGEWRGRPDSGVVELWLDDELVARNAPIDIDEENAIISDREAFDAQEGDK